MSPVDLYPMGKMSNCTVNPDGTISLPQRVIDGLSWQIGDEIAASYIPSPITLLLRAAPAGHPGYKLSYLSRNGQSRSGGKLNCRAFTNHVLRPKVPLPQRNVQPVLLRSGDYDLALLFEAIPWMSVDCSMAGCQQIPTGATGVYQLLGSDHAPLKIGEGAVQNRLREHLRDERLVRLARTMQYIILPKEDGVILEKVLLALYEDQHQVLPPFNAIRA